MQEQVVIADKTGKLDYSVKMARRFASHSLCKLIVAVSFWPLSGFCEPLLGSCSAEPASKVYLSDLSADLNSHSQLVTQIGKAKILGLKDSVNEHFFFCRLNCQIDTLASEIWVTLSDDPVHFADLSGFLCPGVSIETVVIVGDITGPAPVVHPFSPLSSTLEEVSQWLIHSHFQASALESQEIWQKVSPILTEAGRAYFQADSLNLNQAGAKLIEIANRTSQGCLELQNVKTALDNLSWRPQLNPKDSNSFVELLIATAGRELRFTSGVQCSHLERLRPD